MAPKGKYTRSRLAAAAAQSAATARTNLPNASALEQLTCEYVHAPDEANTYADGSLRWVAPLTFRWCVKCAGYEEHFDVTARCSNVVQRGVPLPAHWWTAMQCLNLGRRAEASMDNVRDPSISDVRCSVLGQAKELQSPTSESEAVAGKTVALQMDGARAVFYLCAHVQDGLWLYLTKYKVLYRRVRPGGPFCGPGW